MLEFALSTVATPDRTIAEVLSIAEHAGYDAVELRTFGESSTRFACDPALTDEPKTRTLIQTSGVACCSLATGVAFDEPVRPPIIGRTFFDQERPVREAKRAIDLAAQIDAPLVRVFAHDRHGSESIKETIKRVTWRLGLACDHARNTGVKLVLENGGAFTTAEALADLIDRVNSPFLGASYNAAVGIATGDDPAAAVATLDDRLLLARVKDTKDGTPAEFGDGELDIQRFVESLAAARLTIPVVFEWDAAWFADIAPIEDVAPQALERLCQWAGQTAPVKQTA